MKKASQGKKPQFVTELKPTISYDPVVDKHLEYYFNKKTNILILQKNGIINKKKQITDKVLS